MTSTTRASSRGLRLRALGGALGGSAIAFTLMACYGAAPPAPCPDGTRDCLKTDDKKLDEKPAAPATSASPSSGDAGK